MKMNNYLANLSQWSEAIAKQFRVPYRDTRLPSVNPYGRDYFSIPQTTKAEHMYPNIILVKVTNKCLGGCVFCFRRYERNTSLDDIKEDEIRKIFNEYIPHYNHQQSENRNKIKEVLITGGDPFLLELGFLENILKSAKNSGIELIRVGSRSTSVSPWLITDDLVAMLKNYQPIIVVSQYNHIDELTKESLEASERILNSGIRIKNQSVLLRRINDNIDDLYNLFWELNKNGIQPYRLYHCMPTGYQELRTKVKRGMELTKALKEMGGTAGHFDYGILTPLGKVINPSGDDILDEKKWAELIEVLPKLKDDPNSIFLKLRITSKTIKDGKIPKEAWYKDGVD